MLATLGQRSGHSRDIGPKLATFSRHSSDIGPKLATFSRHSRDIGFKNQDILATLLWVPNIMMQQALKNWGAPKDTGGVNAL